MRCRGFAGEVLRGQHSGDKGDGGVFNGLLVEELLSYGNCVGPRKLPG